MRDLTALPVTKRVASACVALVLFAGIVAASTKSDDGSVGQGRLTTKGRAAVTSVDGHRREVSGVVALHTGEIVEAVDGAMTIELPDGSVVEGRAAFKKSDATRLKIERPVELSAGDVLVVAARGTDIVAGGNHVHLAEGVDGDNAMRVSRSLAVGATVYRGVVSFDSAGQVRSIPALRTLEVSALGHPPAAPAPLQIDASDSWDRRFLGEAIDLGNTLDNYSRSYTQSLGSTNSASPAYYRSLFPSLRDEADLTAELLASTPHPPGETVIGAAIAALSRRGPFAQRWHDLFAFRDEGATWGLVVLDQGVAAGALLTEVKDALDATPFPFALGATSTTAGTTTTTTGSTSTTSTSTSTTESGGTTTTAPPPPPTTVVPAPPTGSPLVDTLVNDVNETLGGVVGQPPQP